ncbi:hypothetical protein C1645_840189 [Glomus cerebriforme]|uniref:Uncharacterized protein n=1 Tax=Glomus cerebriforme TaxID=658196 RepID=A0A397S2E9_9GLOM|nr:hypothetical protein C1645_840189 [Glomus cerebriforme]
MTALEFYKSSEFSYLFKIKSEVDHGRNFTLKSLGAPEMVHLPVDIIERKKFSKTAGSLIEKSSAEEILSKRREELKRSLKQFISVTFPSSTNPYDHLLSSPGPIYNLEKLYLANRQTLKPPKYKIYYDISIDSYFCTLEFKDNIDISDAMPTKILAKLHVAHKVLIEIKRQIKEKKEKEKVAKRFAEKLRIMKEMAEETKLVKDKNVKDQPPKDFYFHPRVQSLWADKDREPEDDNWFMENISRRNFLLFSEFYPNVKRPKFISKKRKAKDYNEVNEKEHIQEQVNKKIKIEEEMVHDQNFISSLSNQSIKVIQ